MTDNIREYDAIKDDNHSELLWIEKNEYCTNYGEKALSIQRDNLVYSITISCSYGEKQIKIQCNNFVKLEKLYLWISKIRRFEYLFDGAFYVLQRCEVDNEDITDIIHKVEVGYFQNAKYKYEIPLVLDEKTYKKLFLKWLTLEKRLGIINQMVLYANNVKGLPVDVRISMLTECYEALARRLEKKGVITIIPEPNTYRRVVCPHCDKPHDIPIRGKKTLACCLMAILDRFGNPIFMTEYRRKKSLVNHIVKTRNKVFHVNSRQKKTLKGSYSGFYVIKLDWLYRYIILVLMGVNREKLNKIVCKQILNFEQQHPNLLYKSRR